MGKNRDRLSIIAAILEAANSGSSKTRIMYMANLSFNLLEKYLAVTSQAGFIQINDSKYSLTERGREFLQEYKKYFERYNRAQKIVEFFDSERERLAKLCQKHDLDDSVRPIMNPSSNSNDRCNPV